jgi:hypothetical protein
MLTIEPPDAMSSVVPLVTDVSEILEPLATICIDIKLYPGYECRKLYSITITQQAEVRDSCVKRLCVSGRCRPGFNRIGAACGFPCSGTVSA